MPGLVQLYNMTKEDTELEFLDRESRETMRLIAKLLKAEIEKGEVPKK